MCRAGGPRCKGSGGRQDTPATTTAPEPATAPEPVRTPPAEAFESLARAAQDTHARTHGQPTRDDTDRLAAAYDPNAKDYAGKPLDDKARRLYALRDSGYRGPVDQDGYPETTTEAAATLRRMATDRGETVDW